MKKIIDDKGRLFGKISVIDIIVILVVIVLAAAVYMKTHVNETTSTATPTENITYYVKITTVRQSTVDALKVGDVVYDDNGNEAGKITNIQVTDATVSSTLLDGTYITAHSEDRYDIVLALEVPCTISEGRYYANKTKELSINSLRDLYTRYLGFTATIIDIEGMK